MLSMYEATHLRVHGEDILDQALAFTTTHLYEAMATCANSSLASEISHALKQPIRKGLPRLEARQYMPIYQEDSCHNEAVLTVAKLDFNMLQRLHQNELSEIAKRILTKVIAMTSVIDDIYDVYGTLEELVLFTKAVERWDISEKDHLPEYMQISYQALLDVYKEIEEIMTEQGKLYRLDYAKEAMKNQVRAYFREAEWFHNHHIPTMEEYMPIALVTFAYSMLATTSFVGMGDVATEEAFARLFSDPKIVTASAIVCRLMDDVVSHKFEQKRGHVASAIECYMKQHGATEQEAVKEFQEQITDAWKDINEECLDPTTIPMPLLVRILNLARVIDVVYKTEDGYTQAGVMLKHFVASLLIDPVIII
ncbi:hypothetical protein CRYUN_Cryun34aG0104600 [Craigia yunnanensis]